MRKNSKRAQALLVVRSNGGYMENRYRLRLSVLCWCLISGLLAAEIRPLQAQDEVGFAVDAISVRSDEGTAQTRLDLYTQIPYSQLSFAPGPGGFTATYEIVAEVSVLDERGRPTSMVQSPIWGHSVTVAVYAFTKVEQQFAHTTHSLLLDPGRYLLALQLIDENSQETYFHETIVEVRDLAQPLALSDIVLLEEFDEETNTIHPHVSGDLGASQLTIEVFYEVYADAPRTVTVMREVLPMRKGRSALLRAGRTLLGLRDKASEPAVLFSDSETRNFSKGRHQIVSRLALTELDVGDYLIRVTLRGPDGEMEDVSGRMFSARWTGLATHLNDLDQAIDQLVYCARNRDVNAIRNAPSYEERLRRFEAFWRKRDPTPGTGRNERMEEYYYRIDYANRKFGNFAPGWKTDRGQVLILHGYPEDVKRQTFSFDAEPWEVWYYYRIGRQFIFVDKTGFGDYELVVPIWDERTRIR